MVIPFYFYKSSRHNIVLVVFSASCRIQDWHCSQGTLQHLLRNHRELLEQPRTRHQQSLMETQNIHSSTTLLTLNLLCRLSHCVHVLLGLSCML